MKNILIVTLIGICLVLAYKLYHSNYMVARSEAYSKHMQNIGNHLLLGTKLTTNSLKKLEIDYKIEYPDTTDKKFNYFLYILEPNTNKTYIDGSDILFVCVDKNGCIDRVGHDKP